MSPCYKQASVAIHFTWKQDWTAVSALLPLIEQALAPLTARPHWGKLFTMSPAALASLYVQLPAFRKVAAQYNPLGKFRNAFLDKYHLRRVMLTGARAPDKRAALEFTARVAW